MLVEYKITLLVLKTCVLNFILAGCIYVLISTLWLMKDCENSTSAQRLLYYLVVYTFIDLIPLLVTDRYKTLRCFLKWLLKWIVALFTIVLLMTCLILYFDGYILSCLLVEDNSHALSRFIAVEVCYYSSIFLFIGVIYMLWLEEYIYPYYVLFVDMSTPQKLLLITYICLALLTFFYWLNY